MGWGRQTLKSPEIAKWGTKYAQGKVGCKGRSDRRPTCETPGCGQDVVAAGTEQRRARAGPPGEPSHVARGHSGRTEGPMTCLSQSVPGTRVRAGAVQLGARGQRSGCQQEASCRQGRRRRPDEPVGACAACPGDSAARGDSAHGNFSQLWPRKPRTEGTVDWVSGEPLTAGVPSRGGQQAGRGAALASSSDVVQPVWGLPRAHRSRVSTTGFIQQNSNTTAGSRL